MHAVLSTMYRKWLITIDVQVLVRITGAPRTVIVRIKGIGRRDNQQGIKIRSSIDEGIESCML